MARYQSAPALGELKVPDGFKRIVSYPCECCGERTVITKRIGIVEGEIVSCAWCAHRVYVIG